MIWPWCTTLKTWKDFLIIHPTYSIYPFSPLTTHITHNGDGFEQVDPFLTIYKKNKSYSPKASSNYSLLSILVSYWFNRRRVLDWVTPVTLIVLFFFLGLTVITIARSILAYWFSCIISFNFRIFNFWRIDVGAAICVYVLSLCVKFVSCQLMSIRLYGLTLTRHLY